MCNDDGGGGHGDDGDDDACGDPCFIEVRRRKTDFVHAQTTVDAGVIGT